MGLNVKLKNDESKFSPILTFSGKNRCLNVTKVKYGRHGRTPTHQTGLIGPSVSLGYYYILILLADQVFTSQHF